MMPHINYWAVLVAAIVNFVLGWLWYGPLFGKPWAKMVGMDMSKKPPMATMVKSMLLMFIGSLLMSYVLDNGLIFGNSYLGMSGWMAGVQGSFWYWLGLVAPVTMSPVLWENKPWKLWFMNAGYYLVGMCVMGMILTSWM